MPLSVPVEHKGTYLYLEYPFGCARLAVNNVGRSELTEARECEPPAKHGRKASFLKIPELIYIPTSFLFPFILSDSEINEYYHDLAFILALIMMKDTI